MILSVLFRGNAPMIEARGGTLRQRDRINRLERVDIYTEKKESLICFILPILFILSTTLQSAETPGQYLLFPTFAAKSGV